jgi:hypothetical protein
MKLLLISCIIFLSIFSIKTNKLLLIGFSNFQITPEEGNKRKFSFDILFKKDKSFDDYDFLFLNVTISNGTIKQDVELNCDIKKEYPDKLEDDLSYICKDDLELNKIEKLNASKTFLFSNRTLNISFDDEIMKSSLIDKSIDNIQNQKTIKYYTYYLKKVNRMNNNFILQGTIDKKLNDIVAYFDLGEQKYPLKINETQITFTVKEYIDEHLNGKIGEITDGENKGEYILIYKNETIDDLARFISSDSKLFVQVIGAGSFIQDEKGKAKGHIYIRGSPELLKSLRRYIRFSAYATYDNGKLRNLAEVLANAIGEKNDTISTGKLVVYNVSFTNLSNSTLIDLRPKNNFEFSEDLEFTNPETQLTVDINPNINLKESSSVLPDVIVFKDPKNPVKNNPSSFEIEFDTTSTTEPLKLSSNESDSFFQYPNKIGSNITEEIKCTLFNKTNSKGYYKILCSTRKSINAILRDVSIRVPPQISRKVRILQTNNNNKTLYFPSDANEIMNYEYSAIERDFFRKSKSSGLSAGAIVAIILSSIAALVAVGLVFFFLRKNQSPPVIKNQPDFNVINSTSNINN